MYTFLKISKVQTDSSTIWTQNAVSISNNDKYFTTSTAIDDW